MEASFLSTMLAGQPSTRTRSTISTFVPEVTKRVDYKNPEVDKLIDEEQKTGDPKKREALLQQVSRILMEDAPLFRSTHLQKSTVLQEMSSGRPDRTRRF